MKAKFIFPVIILLIGRILDFYSTAIWYFQPNGPSGEMNPLSSILGLGFTALVVSNIIIVALVIYAFYIWCYIYRPFPLKEEPKNLIDFISILYFEERGKAYKILYSSPKCKIAFRAHLGYGTMYTIIIGSYLAVFHNLCQFYSVGFYDTFREIVHRPAYVIYGITIFSFFCFEFYVLNREYKARLALHS